MRREPLSCRRSYYKINWLDCIVEMGCPRSRGYNLKWWRCNYKLRYTRFILNTMCSEQSLSAQWDHGQPRRKNRKGYKNDI